MDAHLESLLKDPSKTWGDHLILADALEDAGHPVHAAYHRLVGTAKSQPLPYCLLFGSNVKRWQVSLVGCEDDYHIKVNNRDDDDASYVLAIGFIEFGWGTVRKGLPLYLYDGRIVAYNGPTEELDRVSVVALTREQDKLRKRCP